MSLFLGKIHHWLYNKILWFEKIEAEILKWADLKGLPAEEWAELFGKEYGEPAGNRPLEEIIDTSNIHGWLQQKIESAELRQAALVTQILIKVPSFKEQLAQIYIQQGEAAAKEYEGQISTPEDAYNVLNDFILEGMPCDRVSEIKTNTAKKFSWETTQCLHREYWERVNGDVQNFYDLREAWVKSFIKSLDSSFSYEKGPDNTNIITKNS
ncbi:MAG: hypothetical protein K0R31_94 [Clostridiales bacterium]|jgi:hypothetical protein|nr:hypothetical protein [Clostridiales bacterium]